MLRQTGSLFASAILMDVRTVWASTWMQLRLRLSQTCWLLLDGNVATVLLCALHNCEKKGSGAPADRLYDIFERSPAIGCGIQLLLHQLSVQITSCRLFNTTCLVVDSASATLLCTSTNQCPHLQQNTLCFKLSLPHILQAAGSSVSVTPPV